MNRAKIDVARAKASMLDAAGVTAQVERHWAILDKILARTRYQPFVYEVRGAETEIGTDPIADFPICIRVPTYSVNPA